MNRNLGSGGVSSQWTKRADFSAPDPAGFPLCQMEPQQLPASCEPSVIEQGSTLLLPRAGLRREPSSADLCQNRQGVDKGYLKVKHGGRLSLVPRPLRPFNVRCPDTKSCQPTRATVANKPSPRAVNLSSYLRSSSYIVSFDVRFGATSQGRHYLHRARSCDPSHST
jgi:hypothetical protein